MIMKKKLSKINFLLFFIIIFVLNPQYRLDAAEKIVAGEYQKYHSKILDEDFIYFVSLPSSYMQSHKRYPVLYVLNAQKKTTLASAWATINSLSFELIPELILIGLCNTGKASEYFPIKPDGSPGNADRLLRFLIDEFVSFVDESYRTVNYRILMGQSNTGFFDIYALCAQPNAFQAYIASSPTLGWGLDYIKEIAQETFSGKDPLRSVLYMVYGENDYPDLVIDPLNNFKEFLSNKAPSGFEWHLDYLENDGHVPIPSLNNGLLFLFADYFLSEVQRLKGLEWVDNHYRELSKRYGFEITAPEEVLFFLCHNYKQQKEYSNAINLFTVLLDRYPSSLRGHYFLGEVYEEKGLVGRAIACFAAALEINPEFAAARMKLENLKKK
jgi:predicted alpha/beta superfamily hydrolase